MLVTAGSITLGSMYRPTLEHEQGGAVTVGVRVNVGVGDGVIVGVSVGDGVIVGVSVFVGVEVKVGVDVGVEVAVFVAVGVHGWPMTDTTAAVGT